MDGRYNLSEIVSLFYEDGDFLCEIWVLVLSMTLWYVSSTMELVICVTALSNEGKACIKKWCSFSSLCLVKSGQFASL